MRNSIYPIPMRSNSAAYHWLPGQLARNSQWYAMDEKNLPKQLAEFYADRHEHKLRFSRKLGCWLYYNGERWSLDYFRRYHDAAPRLCREAAERMRSPNVDTPAMASTLLRLASFSPKMTAAIERETELRLEGLLRRREARQ